MVDGTGGRHGAAVLRHHREVRGAVVVGEVKLRLVVAHVMGCPVCNLSPEMSGIGMRGDVLNELEKEREKMFKNLLVFFFFNKGNQKPVKQVITVQYLREQILVWSQH